MNIWKRLIIALALVCLLAAAMPMAYAAGEDDKRGLDYTELMRQIGIANGLEYFDYTQETWDVLQTAVEVGNKRMEGIYDQAKLDSAAKDIADAIAQLVKMDYSPLTEALDAVYAKIDEDEQRHDVWYRLDKAVDKARPLLISGDQQAVNEMAAQLEALLKELADCGEITVEPEVIIQEVMVEVPPTSAFCNIPQHRTWPVLFLISVVLNVLLIAAIVFMQLKKRKIRDDMPLVNYDIDDDMEF